MLYHILVVLSLFLPCQGCSCDPTVTLENAYCEADAVVHLSATSIAIDYSNKEFPTVDYGVKYIKIYRQAKTFEMLANNTMIHTEDSKVGCGLPHDLTKHPEWFFYMYVSDNRPQISMCLPFGKWSKDVETKFENELIKIKCAGDK